MEYLFVVGSLVALIVAIYPYLQTVHLTDYQFYTVNKIVGKYNEPVYLSFHWKTEDEVITGKPVEVWIETHLPYSSIDNLKEITVEFKGIGYYRESSENLFERISQEEKVILKSEDDTNKIFKSDPIKIRYATEGIKSVLFCDYNVASSCTEVPDVIEVAPRYTSYEISVAKLILIGTIAIYLLTVALVLFAVRLHRDISKLGKSLA